MKISKASPADINAIMELVHKAVKAMNGSGVYQWDESYPNKEIVADDIMAKSLFKIAEGKEIAGIIVLNEQYFPQYTELEWEDRAGKFLIVHRLCIHPEYQGKGLAKKLMEFAGEFALDNGYTSIRLDTFTANRKALGLYDSLGYRRVGLVNFTKGKFQCFEKALKRS